MNIKRQIKKTYKTAINKHRKMCFVSIFSILLVAVVISFSKQEIITPKKLDFFVETIDFSSFK
jgi:hypothetical protein